MGGGVIAGTALQQRIPDARSRLFAVLIVLSRSS